MILLYDGQMRFLGPMDTAIRCGYTQNLNDVDTAEIVMAADDPANARIEAGDAFARIMDGGQEIGVFRFEAAHWEAGDAPEVTYSLTGAACTLTDRMLTDWHELGGTGFSTRDVIEYILARQSPVFWRLGVCDFTDYYQYNFEDVTLLEALMSLGEVLTEDYAFEFDTRGEPPWTMNLRRLGKTPACALAVGRNTRGIASDIDRRVVTKLYGRGYGEGDNQLTIGAVNGGKDYLLADTAARWGEREGVHVDRRQTDPATLKARMQAVLERGKNPRATYEADALDLYRISGERWDLLKVGDMAMMHDPRLGTPTSVRITKRAKQDIFGDPGSVRVTLDTQVRDTAQELEEVLEKIGVQELYSQGATNLYSMQQSDNCDALHPLLLRFYVPGNALRINSCLITWKLESFRTYVTLAKAGGASTRTSSVGGGATVSLPAEVVTSEAATGSPLGGEGTAAQYTEANEAGLEAKEAGSHRHTQESHLHNMANHKHASSDSGPSPATTYAQTPAINYAGSHVHEIDPHTHRYDHYHRVTAKVTIPTMEFDLSAHAHTVTLPAHEHELSYGVYESGRASAVQLIVDGTEIPAGETGEGNEMDVARYMRADADGKILRGSWHEIEFVPDGLTRITANLFFQVFIQSRGAGDY